MLTFEPIVKHTINKMIAKYNFVESDLLKWNQIIHEINAISWYDILANNGSKLPTYSHKNATLLITLKWLPIKL